MRGWSVVGVVCSVALLAAASAAADVGWTPTDDAAPPAAAVATKAAPKTVEQDPLPTPVARSEASVQPVAGHTPAVPVAASADSQGDEPPSPPEPEPAPPAPSYEPCASVHEERGCEVPASYCTILGTDSGDWLKGTTGNDVVCGLGGDDRLVGRDGDDVLVGGDGDDQLTGGDGSDCFVGGPGSDRAEDGTQSEEAAVEEPPGLDDRFGVVPDGSCRPFDESLGAIGEIEGASTAGPGGVGAVAAAAGTIDTRAELPVKVLSAIPAGRAVTLRLRCDSGDEAGTVLLSDRRNRRLGAGRFRCDGRFPTVRIKLTRRGRQVLARADRITARVRVEGDSTHAEYRVPIIRESDG
jgi:hypothetical protein